MEEAPDRQCLPLGSQKLGTRRDQMRQRRDNTRPLWGQPCTEF